MRTVYSCVLSSTTGQVSMFIIILEIELISSMCNKHNAEVLWLEAVEQLYLRNDTYSVSY